MTDTPIRTGPDARGGMDSPAADALLRAGRFFARTETSPDLRAVYRKGGRDGDVFYRDRWSHDKVVRSTHGVNCTGSCSWKVYVKDGIITWETQQTDYPSVGPDSPEYEPRGCPRGAAFSWYTYSPTRVRYPYARGVLVEMYREAKARLGDPVAAALAVDRPQVRRGFGAREEAACAQKRVRRGRVRAAPCVGPGTHWGVGHRVVPLNLDSAVPPSPKKIVVNAVLDQGTLVPRPRPDDPLMCPLPTLSTPPGQDRCSEHGRRGIRVQQTNHRSEDDG